MDIKFDCVSCGTHIVIDEAGAEMSVDCPKCGQTQTVPKKSATESTIPPALSAPDPALFYTLFRGRGPAKPTQIAAARYFYQKDRSEGPFNKLEMRALMRKKTVEPETLVLCPATQQWQPCERFPELPKPAHNKLLHFEKDARFAPLIQEIPRMIVEHIHDKISEADLARWLVSQIQACGYLSPDYDEGTINDLVSDERVSVIIKTNRQTWFNYLNYLQMGGSAVLNKPELIGF